MANSQTVFNVSLYDVKAQRWLCWEEPFIGAKHNIRAIVAQHFERKAEDLDDYDWSVVPAGSVRLSLEVEE